jgi:L-threonylcarbamoyladenylate synthase
VDGAKNFLSQAMAAAQEGHRVGLMLPEGFPLEGMGQKGMVYRWGPWSNEEELAHRLFAGLRWLDAAGATVILCPLPEAKGIGVAIRDRLKKAARE